MHELTKLTVRSSQETLEILDEAREWARVSQGRFSEYKRIYNEFINEKKFSKKHLLAHYELMDIVEIYGHWKDKLKEFPGLHEQIRVSLSKGPFLSQEENVDASSNRSRNEIFTYIIAGKLLASGISVKAVEGLSHCTEIDLHKKITSLQSTDVVIEIDGTLMVIECKRPQSIKAIKVRSRDAAKQIRRSGRSGIIAIDCSMAIWPSGTILSSSSEEAAIDFIGRKALEAAKYPIEKGFEQCVLGAMIYTRVPAHTGQTNPILGATGSPLISYRQDSLHSLDFLPNMSCSSSAAFRTIYDLILVQIRRGTKDEK